MSAVVRRERPATLVFDCDGVILNSNSIKTEAFRIVASQFGDAAALSLVDYHTQHGGISRFEKFRYLLETILSRSARSEQVEALCGAYADQVYSKLLECDVASGLVQLREADPDTPWMVVSGGAQAELRRLFAARGIDRLFDAGIFGSPDTKDEILGRELAHGRLVLPAVFFGDSRYDHEAATRAGLKFVFVSDWTEFDGWESYCAKYSLPVVANLTCLLDAAPGPT